MRKFLTKSLLVLIAFSLACAAYQAQTSAVSSNIVKLKDKRPAVRIAAAKSLGISKDTAAVEPLIAALKSDNSNRRKSVATALGFMFDPRAVEPLILALKDPDNEIRIASAQALQLLGDERAIDPLIVMLKNEDPLVRGAAADALGNLNAIDAVDDLVLLLKDEDNKRDAALALGNIASPRAIEVVMTAAKNHDLEVIAGAYEFFVKRNTPAIIPALIDALNEYGDASITEAFLSSGNSKLAVAPRAWAEENGYEIVANPTSGRSKRRRRR